MLRRPLLDGGDGEDGEGTGHRLPPAREVLDLLLFAAAVGALVSGAAIVGLPYLIRTSLGLSARLYGAAESAMGLAALLGGLAAGGLAAGGGVEPQAIEHLPKGLGAHGDGGDAGHDLPGGSTGW